jgi:hypothetical protein
LRFDRAINLALLDLTGGPAPVPDLVLTGPGGPVAGSFVADADGMGGRFIKAGGPLTAGSYGVLLRSAVDGVVDLAGHVLDGDANGSAGGDFTRSFAVAASSGAALALPELARVPDLSAREAVVVLAQAPSLPAALPEQTPAPTPAPATADASRRAEVMASAETAQAVNLAVAAQPVVVAPLDAVTAVPPPVAQARAAELPQVLVLQSGESAGVLTASPAQTAPDLPPIPVVGAPAALSAAQNGAQATPQVAIRARSAASTSAPAVVLTGGALKFGVGRQASTGGNWVADWVAGPKPAATNAWKLTI